MTSTPPTASDQRATVVAGFLDWTLDAFDFFLVVMTLTAIAKDFGRSDADIAIAVSVITTRKKSKDRKSTRLNSTHSQISYAVFCLIKKKDNEPPRQHA